jgi:aspartate racemase
MAASASAPSIRPIWTMQDPGDDRYAQAGDLRLPGRQGRELLPDDPVRQGAQRDDHGRRGDWEAAGDVLADSARRLEQAGAGCIVLCTNTMHKLAERITGATRVPFLHLADVTAKAIKRSPSRRPLLLATRFTMEQDFYRDRLRAFGVDAMVPDAAQRGDVHRIIYEELCRGVIEPASKARYLDIVAEAVEQGADGVILGCTEITLLVSQADFAIPVFDTTALHVEAALDALAESASAAA